MKKGFTLIELLAVILILGIIALIAIPTVNNILKEARRGAFESTLNNLEKAIEEKCTTEQIKNIEITTQYTITDGIISPSVDIKGNLPDGMIYVDNNCQVSYTLYNSNFTGIKENGIKLQVREKTIYKEAILNGANPVYSSNLIPVTIADDGTVTKANIFEKWYSYQEKQWANAVILTDEGKVEDDGTILEDSIESYFVWIPRYKYKLFNNDLYGSAIQETPTESHAKTIEIIFENKNNQISVGTDVGHYHSHPAFQAFDVNGFWVAKFEISGTTANIKIKPNQQTLRTINLRTMFESSYNYERNHDSHMMKNTEWGAVTYLSLSNYGINQEININNNPYHLTGYSCLIPVGDNEFTGSYRDGYTAYNTQIGYLASTTGNISGVYDMSGGSIEYMASYSNNKLGNSGFEIDPTITYGNKYFDKYTSNGYSDNYVNRILGDATGEMGPFYKYAVSDEYAYNYNSWWPDISNFPGNSYPWFKRGGSCYSNIDAGQLNFNCTHGGQDGFSGFRLVLAK